MSLKYKSKSEIDTATLFYPVLGAVSDLWFIRLSGVGIGNGFYSYFHSMILAERYGGKVITPAWISFKVGPILRREYSNRFYVGLFKPHCDELFGIDKFVALIKRHSDRVVVEVGAGTKPNVVIGKLNYVICKKFTFMGLHEHRDSIRTRLINIAALGDVNPINWGHGGFVGVHVRLGDFSSTKPGAETASTNTRVPLSWYVNVIKAIRAKYPSLPIRLFSDGSEKELSLLLDCGGKLQRTGSDLGDMLALSSASILVGSNSTYSRWASFLGNIPSIWPSAFSLEERPTSPEIPVEYISLNVPEVNLSSV